MIWWPLVFGVIGTTDSHPTRGLPLHGRRRSVMNLFHAKIALHRMPLLQSVGSSNCARQAE
jgi:hypothetical protein